jgi:hypothetical protein
LAPKWPYTVNTLVALDDQAPTKVDLTDSTTSISIANTVGSETIGYAVLWSATGLANGVHKVVVTRGDRYAVVDGFM